LDNLMVSIVDEQGNALHAGQVGELLVKGPSICSGYLNDPEETRRIFCDGWLRTGDLARKDEEGYLWIEGRKQAFVKMRGMRVSLAEVEERATAIPGVYECAACAVDHPEVGEAVVLFALTSSAHDVAVAQQSCARFADCTAHDQRCRDYRAGFHRFGPQTLPGCGRTQFHRRRERTGGEARGDSRAAPFCH
jgi:acyl-coenzyme A synthetase/AMP-(fatty) acid ligase